LINCLSFHELASAWGDTYRVRRLDITFCEHQKFGTWWTRCFSQHECNKSRQCFKL